MKPEKTESQKIGDELAEEMETYGLYDKVKVDIYNEMMEASKHLKDINTKDIPVGRKEIPYMYHGSDFVATIINLYIMLKPKIEYVQTKEGETRYAKLFELDDYYFDRKDSGKMTFLQAKTYFDLERAFIERLGITRFEIAKLSLNEKIKRSAFESK